MAEFFEKYGEQIKEIFTRYINLLLSFLKDVADIEVDTKYFTEAE